ncbi:hypothetical protein KEM52_004016 [Ascosphaera acerosa]|nr:hypothetical protein KEM52_004016 [Ascosphaera acerosa]
MPTYEAVAHTEHDADGLSPASPASPTDSNDDGQPSAARSGAIRSPSDPTSPGSQESVTVSRNDQTHRTDGFQTVPLEFENLGGSQHLAVANQAEPSVLSSVLDRLRKPSSETMYDLVEADDYAAEDVASPRDDFSFVQGQPDDLIDRPGSLKDAACASMATERLELGRGSLKVTPLAIRKRDNAGQIQSEYSQDDVNQTATGQAFRGRKAAPTSITIPPRAGTVNAAEDGQHDRMSTPSSVLPQTPISVHSTVDIASPRPDLQSIQGAYKGNIVRLEKSAEQLSESPDMGTEIRKMTKKAETHPAHWSDDSSKARSDEASSPSGEVTTDTEDNSSRQGDETVRIADSRSVSRWQKASFSAVTQPTQRQANKQQQMGSSAAMGDTRLSADPDMEHTASFTRSVLPPPTTPSPIEAPRNFGGWRAITPIEHSERHDSRVAATTGEMPRFSFNSYRLARVPDAPYQPGLYMSDYSTHYLDETFYRRPSSAASEDTYQQARTAFKDFDGVHIGLHPRASASIRRFSMTDAPATKKEKAADGRPPDIDGLIYYPAPVPKMLNLPRKIANKNQEDLHNRRTQLLASTIARQSGLLSGDATATDTAKRLQEKLAKLPPALRAAAYFDGPPTAMDGMVIAPLNGSAIQTMDAVLDAAAQAPVNTLVNGAVTAPIPVISTDTTDASRGRKRKSLFRRSESRLRITNNDAAEGSDGERPGTSDQLMPFKRQSTYEADKAMLAPGQDELAFEEDLAGEGQIDSDEDEFHGAPATLLAELELRKKAQKSRTKVHELRSRARTGAGDLGGSTLLELDAVAQLQDEARRKQKHITLAWEGPDAGANDGPDDDEDVPLAVLIQNKTTKQGRSAGPLQRQIDEFKPSGLMAQLEQEENETLGQRRVRLRGEVPPAVAKRGTVAYPMEGMPLHSEEDSDGSAEEGETLAQRAARLKREATETLAERRARLRAENEGLYSDFAQDLLNLFDESQVKNEKEEPATEEVAPGSSGIGTCGLKTPMHDNPVRFLDLNPNQK